MLVHAGFALNTISELDARETLTLLQDMSAAYTGEPAPVPVTPPELQDRRE